MTERKSYSVRSRLDAEQLNRYWDPQIQPQNYSFVDFAIGKGYSIFFYDRIGIGKSQLYVHNPKHTYHL
jgi:hypothetical protein